MAVMRTMNLAKWRRAGRWLCGPLLFALAGAAGAEAIIVSEPEDFAVRVLALHNKARADVGVPPLAWDEALADEARLHAAAMAGEGLFRHGKAPKLEGQGENLFMGTAGAYTIDEMIGAWTRERTLLRGPGEWLASFPAVGHYTQMVWRTTSRLGCAMARNRSDEYLVCRYQRVGNVRGEPVF
jgi:hypothetical protein